MKQINLGVIGTGNMALQHLKVITKIKNFNPYGITSKTNKNSKNLSQKFNIKHIYDSYIELIKDSKIDAVLLLVSADQTYKILKKILEYQKPVFIEKPPCLSIEELNILIKKNKKYKTLNMVGYNRRFYSIFNKGLKIAEKGKILGILIEGHEKFWQIKKIINQKLIDKWIYANSSHTIDLLRFFGGEFNQVYSLQNLSNKKNSNQFTAILKSNKNIHCGYIAYWDSPGGWSITIFGDKFKIVFSPLEKGFWIDKNFKKRLIKPNKIDILYKPGFYQQMLAFKNLITYKKIKFPGQSIEDIIKTFEIIKKISL